jgi:MerR family transcriptional regulator/heat shock protein HspR
VAQQSTDERVGRDPTRPVYVISVAAELVRVHPRTLRIYELEGLICPARTRSNIRLYSENDVRRVLWIRHLTRNLGVNLAGVRVLFELEERLGMRILETLYEDNVAAVAAGKKSDSESTESTTSVVSQSTKSSNPDTFDKDQAAVSPLTRSGTTQGAK